MHLSVRGGEVFAYDHYPWCIGPLPSLPEMGPEYLSLHLPCYWHLVVSTGDLFKLVYLRTSLMVLTSNGGDRDMYSWQIGSTYPTGMLYCFFMRFAAIRLLLYQLEFVSHTHKYFWKKNNYTLKKCERLSVIKSICVTQKNLLKSCPAD